jgi:hypothetical protein
LQAALPKGDGKIRAKKGAELRERNLAGLPLFAAQLAAEGLLLRLTPGGAHEGVLPGSLLQKEPAACQLDR